MFVQLKLGHSKEEIGFNINCFNLKMIKIVIILFKQSKKYNYFF